MSTLPASIRHAAAKATLSFDWLLPAEKPMLRIADIATATGMRSTYLEEYFADKCHRYPSGGTGARPPMRIPRAFAVELLVTSARYTAEEKRDALISTFREFGEADLVQMRAALDAEILRKSGAGGPRLFARPAQSGKA